MTGAVLLTCSAAVLVMPLPPLPGAAVVRARGFVDAMAAALRRLLAARREAFSAARAAEQQWLSAAELVEVLVAELRAGRPPEAALAEAAAVPGCAALGPAQRAVALGADAATALGDVRGPPPIRAALARVAVGWQVAERSGAPLAQMLAGIETDLRAAVTMRRRVREELAGTRATATILAVLPGLGLLLGAAMGAHPLRTLVHTRTGVLCVIAGIAFEAAGALWVRRLVRAAQDRP